MRAQWNLLWAGAIALSLVGALALWFGRAPVLEFRDRAYPEGFRELVLESGLSRFDPIIGLPLAPGVSRGDRPKRSMRDICDALFQDPDSPAIGNPHSPVQIAAFLDYRCPYCRTLTRILSGMPGNNLRVIFKEWPVLGEGSVLAARAALAAARQGRYLDFHQRLMASRFMPTTTLVEDLAADLGLSRSQLRQDMTATDIASALERNAALASELGFIGTPVLAVGRTIVQGAITQTQLEALVRSTARLDSAASC